MASQWTLSCTALSSSACLATQFQIISSLQSTFRLRSHICKARKITKLRDNEPGSSMSSNLEIRYYLPTCLKSSMTDAGNKKLQPPFISLHRKAFISLVLGDSWVSSGEIILPRYHFVKEVVNKLGLSCAKLRVSCDSQFRFDGQKRYNKLVLSCAKLRVSCASQLSFDGQKS